MNCFLHIGTEKTGTTTVQDFFYINRKVLGLSGFHFSQTIGQKNHRLLALSVYDLSRRDDITKRHGLDSETDLKAYQAKLKEKLRDEIMLAKKTNDTLVFSSEHIHSRLTKISEITRLRDLLRELGITQIIVIVYLRRPSAIAASLYSTSVKAGSSRQSPPPPSHSYWNNACNHQATLENYCQVFGQNFVIPRLFDTKEFPEGSIVFDILEIMNIPRSSTLRYPSNSNERLSAKSLEVLRFFNKKMPKYIGGRPNFIRAILIRLLSVFFRDDKYSMSKELDEQYEKEFEESNEWTRKKYFPHKSHLFGRENL